MYRDNEKFIRFFGTAIADDIEEMLEDLRQGRELTDWQVEIIKTLIPLYLRDYLESEENYYD